MAQTDGNVEEEEEASGEPAEASGFLKIPKRLIAPISSALLATVLAAVFCFVIFPPPAETKPDTKEPGPILDEDLEGFEPAMEIPLPEVIVNLADESRETVLKIRLTIQFRALDSKVVEDHIISNARTIKDALITHLSSKVSTELKSPQGKELLKWELIDLLTPLVLPDLAEGKIMAILYEELLFQ